MSERFDLATWSALQARLSAVESHIPDAPPWRPAVDTSGRVGFGSAFRRDDTRPGRRSRLVLVLALVGLLVALVAGALLIGAPRPRPDLSETPFGPLGQLRGSDGRANAALLPDGQVVVVSGEWVGLGNVGARVATWDAEDGFELVEPPNVGRISPTVTLLLDGRILVVGGYGGPYQYASSAVATAEIWDPTTEGWTMTGSMANARVGHTAVLLADGRVAIMGGAGPDGGVAAVEVWDPATGRFSGAGSLAPPRFGHAAVLLDDGRVLVAAGRDYTTGDGLGRVEIWDPSSLQLTGLTDLLDAPGAVGLIRLPDGRIFVTGAYVVPYGPANFAGVMILSPSGGPGGSAQLLEQREAHATTLLADGRVLATGGRSSTGEVLASVELWDPADGQFHRAPPLPRGVANHGAILLADGRVLIVPDWSGPDGVIEPFVYDPRAEP